MDKTMFQTAYANYFHCTKMAKTQLTVITSGFKPLTRIIFTARATKWIKSLAKVAGFKPLTRIIFTALVALALSFGPCQNCFKPLTRIIFTALPHRRYRGRRINLRVSNRLRELFSLHANYQAEQIRQSEKGFKPLTRIIFTARANLGAQQFCEKAFQTAYANYFHCTKDQWSW